MSHTRIRSFDISKRSPRRQLESRPLSDNDFAVGYHKSETTTNLDLRVYGGLVISYQTYISFNSEAIETQILASIPIQ